jgi:hypothetical protein
MPREIDEAWIDEAIERHQRLDALRAEYERVVAAHVVTVQSPDGSVELLVSATGSINEVRIRGSLHNRTGPDLAREVQAVVTNAAQAAQWARQKLHDEVFGGFRVLGEQ